MHTLQACSRAVAVTCSSLSAGRQRVFFLPFSPRIRRDAAAVSLLREAVLYEIKTEAPLEKRKPAFVGLRRSVSKKPPMCHCEEQSDVAI